MDPDETLNQLRNRVNNEFDLYELQQLFNSLDDWLCGGGFLPHDWKLSKK